MSWASKGVGSQGGRTSYAQPATSVDTTGARRTTDQLLTDITKSLAEADVTAGSTVNKLHEQTEVLHRIQGRGDDIANNLDQSETLLRDLKGGAVKSFFRNLFKGSPAPKPPQPQGPKGGDAAPSTTAPGNSRGLPDRLVAQEAERRAALGLGAGASASSAAAGLRPPPRMSKQESERDKALDHIDRLLDNLGDKTREIGRTLDHHNKVLPKIADSVDRSQGRLSSQMRDMKHLAR